MVKNNIKEKQLLQGIGAGLCLLDRNFRILWINNHQSRWVGAPQKVCGTYCYKTFEHRNHICPGCPALKVFKTGKIHQAQRTGFTKDGQKGHYQITVSPIKDNRNRPVFALELVQDITESLKRKRHNSKITRRLKRMYRRLYSVNGRLRGNIDRLKEITRNLSQFKRILQKKYLRKKNELFALKEELQDIFRVNRTLISTVDLEKISSLITRLTCELMHTDNCVLRLVDENRKALVATASYSMSDALMRRIALVKLGEGICGMVAQTNKPLVVYDVNKDPRIKHKELLKKEGLRSFLAVPILFQDKVLGVLSTGSKKARRFCPEEIEVLNIFAAQVAIAIQESRHYDDIHLTYFNTIHALVLSIEARDPYTRGHTERVTKYAVEIARALKMYRTEIEILRYAAEVHDVGKISIPDFILNKAGSLNPAERAMVELHPIKGVEILEPLDFLKSAIPAVRHHHERYDGSGYPDGLDKDKIPLMARILACADAFDAMTSDRPYRMRKLSVEQALHELKNNAGSQFDPYIARIFIKAIQSKFPAKVS